MLKKKLKKSLKKWQTGEKSFKNWKKRKIRKWKKV